MRPALVSHTPWRWAAMRAAACALLFVCVVGCATGPQTKTVEWREEVQLGNGERVIAHRSQRYRLVSEPGAGSGWLFASGRLEVLLRSSAGLVAWEGTLAPIAFDLTDDGTVYLIGVVAAPRARFEYNLSEAETHVAFKRSGDAHWARIPLSEVPNAVRPNLLYNERPIVFAPGFASGTLIDGPAKAKADSAPGLPRYLLDWRWRQCATAPCARAP
jgi:hypothetical protein